MKTTQVLEEKLQIPNSKQQIFIVNERRAGKKAQQSRLSSMEIQKIERKKEINIVFEESLPLFVTRNGLSEQQRILRFFSYLESLYTSFAFISFRKCLLKVYF